VVVQTVDEQVRKTEILASTALNAKTSDYGGKKAEGEKLR